MIEFALKNVNHKYYNNGKVILEDINFSSNQKEIIAILGKSGSGKSTMLRIISGLIIPTEGEMIVDAQTVDGPMEGISIVFQSFALFPWLTVCENIQIGLEAQNLGQDDMAEKVKKMIHMIGLTGYGNAYPKELSGGMKQRVGFARALVTNPKILLMDEAFSALDVLTAQSLHTDLLDLWADGGTNLDAMVVVTHNIEEAVMLADRVVILSSNPGKIVAEIKINLDHPRDRLDQAFRDKVEEIYSLMTYNLKENVRNNTGNLFFIFPRVDFEEAEGFLEVVHSDYKDNISIVTLCDDLDIENEKIFDIIESLQILQFIILHDNTITISPSGRMFIDASLEAKQKILGEHLIKFVPIIGFIRRSINASAAKSIQISELLLRLEGQISQRDAMLAFDFIVSWCRYSNLFKYDDAYKAFLASGI